MNNEIKEILDYLKDFLESNIEDVNLNQKRVRQLLDCITNLQEENERLKEDITTMNDYIGKIQKENNILKENAEHNDKVVDKVKWNEMIYKSRNEKAIEHISEHLERDYFDYDILETNTIYNRDLFKVKNILQGVDKE